MGTGTLIGGVDRKIGQTGIGATVKIVGTGMVLTNVQTRTLSYKNTKATL
jgi:hypothetical protein